jgi:hypothetical protein
MRAITIVVLMAIAALCMADEDVATTRSSKQREDDERRQKEHDEKEEAFKRDLEFEVKADSVEVESKRRDGNTKEKLKFELEIEDDGLEIKMETEKETEVDGREVEMKERLKLTCNSVIVINGLKDATTGYQPGVDEVHNTTSLGDAAWKDITCADTTVTDDAGATSTVKQCTAATKDDLVTFLVELSGDIFVKGDVKVYPTALKITIDLDGQLASNQYYVLGCKVQTKSKGEKREEDSAKKGTVVRFGGDAGTSFFSWESQAITDGNAIDVISSNIEDLGVVEVVDQTTNEKDDDHNRRVYFTFNAPGVGHISWDPQVGAGETFAATLVATATSSAMELSASVASVGAALALFFLW